jgi:hypothetical protein
MVWLRAYNTVTGLFRNSPLLPAKVIVCYTVKDRRLAAHGECAAAEFKGVRHRELQVTKDKFHEK